MNFVRSKWPTSHLPNPCPCLPERSRGGVRCKSLPPFLASRVGTCDDECAVVVDIAEVVRVDGVEEGLEVLLGRGTLGGEGLV